MTDSLSIPELRDWYKSATSKSLQKAHKKASKQIQKVQDKITSLYQTLERNFSEDKTMSDAADEYRRHIFESKHILDKISPPSEINAKNVTQYTDLLNDHLKEFQEIVFKYGRLFVNLDKKSKIHASKVRSLEDSIKRLSQQVASFLNYYNNEFDIVRKTESVFEMLDELEQLKSELAEVEAEIKNIAQKEQKIDEEIASYKEEIQRLEQSRPLVRLKEVREQLSKKTEELDDFFVDIKKLFNKFLKAAQQRKLPLSSDQKQAMKPFTKAITNAIQTSSISTLLSLLNHVTPHLDNPILQLKKERKEKILQAFDDIKQGKLTELWNKTADLLKEKNELLAEIEQLNIEQQINRLNNIIDSLEKEKLRLRASLVRKKKQIKEKAKDLKSQIETTVSQITGKTVELQLPAELT